MILFVDNGFILDSRPGRYTQADCDAMNKRIEERGEEDAGFWILGEGVVSCCDCGKLGVTTGHHDCQYPSAHIDAGEVATMGRY